LRGRQHQRFLLEPAGGGTLLIAHNTSWPGVLPPNGRHRSLPRALSGTSEAASSIDHRDRAAAMRLAEVDGCRAGEGGAAHRVFGKFRAACLLARALAAAPAGARRCSTTPSSGGARPRSRKVYDFQFAAAARLAAPRHAIPAIRWGRFEALPGWWRASRSG
jgi:hypothetical protein